MTEEWGEMLITGWNKAGWMAQPAALGDRIGRLIGAPAGSTVIGDTLSIKVYQALAAALQMRPDRKIVLSDNGNFPTDLYMAEGLIRELRRATNCASSIRRRWPTHRPRRWRWSC
jgi:kynureninase